MHKVEPGMAFSMKAAALGFPSVICKVTVVSLTNPNKRAYSVVCEHRTGVGKVRPGGKFWT